MSAFHPPHPEFPGPSNTAPTGMTQHSNNQPPMEQRRGRDIEDEDGGNDGDKDDDEDDDNDNNNNNIAHANNANANNANVNKVLVVCIDSILKTIFSKINNNSAKTSCPSRIKVNKAFK